MYCYNCGKPLPPDATTCPACQAVVVHPPAAGGSDPVDHIVADVKRATNELLEATARLTRRVANVAGEAAKEPTETAKKATRRVADELERMARAIDQEIKKL